MAGGDMSGSEVLNYRVHPVAGLFPLMEGVRFRNLVEDIRANGQRVPVVLDAEGTLLDGRNRARACQELGIDVKETRYAGDDAEAWIISHNVHRRHLTESQRAMVAARLTELHRGGDRRSSSFKQSSDRLNLQLNAGGAGRTESGAGQALAAEQVSIADAASQLSIGYASVGRAKAVLKSGDQELIRAVESGEKSVTTAAEVARARKKRPPKEQPPQPEQSPKPLTERGDEIRGLVNQGATSEQIAKRFGVTEPRVREVARKLGIIITANQVRGKVRRTDWNRTLDNATDVLEAAAISIRDIDPTQLNRDEALERLDSLTSSINAITKAVRKIKESFRDQPYTEESVSPVPIAVGQG
jgi:DNA-binding CsgD family transcriptional regulator